MKEKNRISRRTFIRRTSGGAALLTLVPATGILAGDLSQLTYWPDGAAELKVHMIGHAHIDPVWLWPWTEGVSVVHSTFQSALDRMNETPDFCFVASSAQFYHWVAENDPAMIDKIRKRVDEGRWNIIGGWWVEPDMNIPGGEAMVRQGLYGQRTLQKLLGRRATIAFNPDSFGHTDTLPQIIKKQGMEQYIFMRPGPHEKTLPADLFWWEGTDGTKVLTYRIQESYNDSGNVRSRLGRILPRLQDQPVKSVMYYFGAGDHGGGATKENIRSIEELKKEKGAPKVLYSTPERYFREILNDKTLTLPVVKDDLQHHAVGCYTAESEIKKGNRQSETALVTAEKIAAIGASAWGANYPREELTKAWHRVLFLQFHDSLAGTSLYEHSQTAREGYGYALDTANLAAYMALQKLEWQVASEDPDSQYLVAFNPHAWEVTAHLEHDFNRGDKSQSTRVEDEKGNSLLHQWTAGSTETGSRKKLIIRASVPPMGYRQFRVRKGEMVLPPNAVKAENNMLENEFLRVHFSKEGFPGIFDKQAGREVFSGDEAACRAIVIDDPSDTWSHDIKTFDREVGRFENAKFSVPENGPLRGIIRTVSRYGSSVLTVDWMLYTGSRQLEAKVTLDWYEHLKMMKLSFPVNVNSPVATYETPYGSIVREANGNEDPGQRWIDVTGTREGNTCGLTVINDAKYGYDVRENDMRISVVRSAVYAHHNPKVLDMKEEYLWMDQGRQTFRLLLVPHRGTWKENKIPRIAEEFSARPLMIYQGIHGGAMPKSGSFLTVDEPGVIVTAVKRSEDGDDVIVRCAETNGMQTPATVDLGFNGNRWKGSFNPFEIKTLRISGKSGDVREVDLLEEATG
ncbi:MAG: glycoside hydrolase family 38 C-terminal domain-containing protein [Mangrovibacterium sp.]|nr:glycoside hydrolase family 38 C-terminal domain-containing protein [Mangrovibacterium sp.]